LRDPRHAPLAADQPPHAEQIEDSDPQPIPHAVIGDAGAARAIDDSDITDAVTFASDERRQKPVQPVEIGKREKEIAAKGFEPAAGVAGAVAQYRSADRI